MKLGIPIRKKMTTLSDRERIVLTLHRQGAPNARIARLLGIHRGSVQRQLDRINEKLAELRHMIAHGATHDVEEMIALEPDQAA